jgi:endonuclease/exonuclease/phosphatase family metal-dependent hydrolase
VAKEKKYSVEEIRRRHARAYAQWTAEDDEKLLRHAHLSVSDLAAMFGRKRGAIRSRRRKLGIGPDATPQAAANGKQRELQPSAESTQPEKTPPPTKRPWTPEDDEKLRQFANVPVPALAEILQRPPDTVEMRLYDLGLYVRGEAPWSLSCPSSFRARRQRWIISVGGFFAAGLLIGLAIGYVVGQWQSPPAKSVRRQPPPNRPVAAGVAQQDACLSVATWNIRGYPESRAEDTEWFHEQLQKLGAEVLCVQEIANSQRVEELLARDTRFTQGVLPDFGGQVNVILAVREMTLVALKVPSGFQHPVQAAFVAYRGFDAVVVTLNLSWDESRRLDEMRLLEPLVRDMLKIDPDLMVVGDFNLQFEEARSRAKQLGMVVLLGSNQTAVGTLYSGNSYDYFLISPDLAAEEAQGATVVVFTGADLEIARRVSDHMPVLAFFACDERFRDRPADENPSQ